MLASGVHTTEDPLYYYHKFEHKHGWVPNAHIPLQQHYTNEKDLRKKLYHVDDELNRMKRAEGFKERDLQREILGEKNQLTSLKSITHATNKLHDQREMAIKEGINHDEKFKEKYHGRLVKNRSKLAKALPDQKAEYSELVSFDKARQNYFLSDAGKKQTELNTNKKENIEFHIKTRQQESGIKAGIV